jgi:hypothetical protein
MTSHPLPGGGELLEYTLHDAVVASGSAESDPNIEKDTRMMDWLDDRTYRVIEGDASNYPKLLAQAIADRIEVVIKKEKQHDKPRNTKKRI